MQKASNRITVETVSAGRAAAQTGKATTQSFIFHIMNNQTEQGILAEVLLFYLAKSCGLDIRITAATEITLDNV